ncbi:DNA polymerase [Duganella sacchari]|uniref:DNA polymerase n=1 Tax=Duganella sacchari TaxID=551987 RepID=A0A1M7QNQ1_9BURK|nr:uracil-DNA glycosylase [Duganella sacchari]SHN32781.1 DNA polymerase [Duganella sacchari]
MSQSARNTAFLHEMGVGVQWKLRNGVEAQADPFAAAVQALADGEPVMDAPVQQDAVVVATPAMAAPAAPLSHAAPSPVEAPSSPAAQQPIPSPAAPRAPAPSLDDDSTAWFDDAPMPPPAPQPAARPVPAAARPAAAPAPAAASEDESTAWFDDAPAPERPEPVSDEAIAAMDWPALKQAVATCTRCPLCATRRTAVNGRGAEQARWVAIGPAPSRQDEKDGQTMSAESGQLLHNMMKAIELQPESDVYVTNLVKCRPTTPEGDDRTPGADEVLACRPFLERELALTSATMAMTFGQFAAKGLMMGPAARGKVMHYGAQQLPVVATYHPDDLLRKPEDKAKAWADLCLAKASHG